MPNKELILPLNAGRDRVVDSRANDPMVGYLNAELRKMDPYLEIVWVGERVPKGVIPGMVPGRWHLRRQPPNLIDSYWPIVGPDGEFRELGTDLIENMKANDLWREGALEELNKRKYRRAEKKAKEKALHQEQLRDTYKADARAADRVFGEGGMTKRKQFQG